MCLPEYSSPRHTHAHARIELKRTRLPLGWHQIPETNIRFFIPARKKGASCLLTATTNHHAPSIANYSFRRLLTRAAAAPAASQASHGFWSWTPAPPRAAAASPSTFAPTCPRPSAARSSRRRWPTQAVVAAAAPGSTAPTPSSRQAAGAGGLAAPAFLPPRRSSARPAASWCPMMLPQCSGSPPLPTAAPNQAPAAPTSPRISPTTPTAATARLAT